jgi:DNA-directed RNA polymerase subunit RPC12/RpoP
MRAKCSKCGNVSEAPLTISLVHIGTLRLMKCPACGKTSMMKAFVNDPVTWPAEEKVAAEGPLTDEELLKKRLEESRYEDGQH